MRSGIRGVLAGALALVTMQTLVGTGASQRVSGLFAFPAAVARWVIDPTVPAIPGPAKGMGRLPGGGQGLRGATTGAGGPAPYPSPWLPPSTRSPTTATGGD